MSQCVQIGDRPVGPDHPVLIIAEIGVNHDGSLQRALELVHAAGRCGADAVKLQLFGAGRLMHRSAGFADYQRSRCADANPSEMLSRYELSEGDVRRIVAEIRRIGLVPLATPFSLSDVDWIASLDLPAIKIASPDLVNRPLLMRAAAIGKPLLVSTGAASTDEIAGACDWLGGCGATWALLHCISSYPVPDRDAHLCWIAELHRRFAVPVGYSDHTTQPLAGALAVAAGACIIEKHITYDRDAAGPDHAASADPGQFARYVALARQAQGLCGRPGKRVLAIEQDVRTLSRQSLVLERSLQAGEVIRAADLIVQRPGTGIPASMLDRAVGRRVRRALVGGTMLTWDMLTDAA
jgi:N-acetylneuraminate synthase/N,N'-diacetyllegionaminate synthase